MKLLFVVLLAAATPPAQPASTSASDPAKGKPPITKETRPDLFADEPPARPGASSLPSEPPREATTGFWISMLFRTVLVLGAVVLLAYLVLNKGLTRLMKITGVKQGKNLVLIERLSLDQKHALFLVEIEGRRFVVGTADQSTSLVYDLTKDQIRDAAPLSAITVDKGTA